MTIRLRDENGNTHYLRPVEDKSLGEVVGEIITAAVIVGVVVLFVFVII